MAASSNSYAIRPVACARSNFRGLPDVLGRDVPAEELRLTGEAFAALERQRPCDVDESAESAGTNRSHLLYDPLPNAPLGRMLPCA